MKRIIIILLFPLFIASIAEDDNWTKMYMQTIMVEGKPYNYLCSSELDAVDPFEGFGLYGAHNLFDDDSATAWVEGVAGYGVGEYFISGLGPNMPEKLLIGNGYQKTESLFKKNSRVKSAKISLFAGFYINGEDTEIVSIYRLRQIGEETFINMQDNMGLQEIPIPGGTDKIFDQRIDLTNEFKSDFQEQIERARKGCPNCQEIVEFCYFLKFEVVDVFPGSSWDDTCISGIKILEVKSDPINNKEIIQKVYEMDGGGSILVDTDIRKALKIVEMRELKEFKELDEEVKMWITLMDVSKDNEWAQVDFMFSAVGRRVDEYSVLYHVRSGRRVGTDILDTMYGMYGFKEEEGKIWLDTADGLVDLDKIRVALEAKY